VMPGNDAELRFKTVWDYARELAGGVIDDNNFAMYRRSHRFLTIFDEVLRNNRRASNDQVWALPVINTTDLLVRIRDVLESRRAQLAGVPVTPTSVDSRSAIPVRIFGEILWKTMRADIMPITSNTVVFPGGVPASTLPDLSFTPAIPLMNITTLPNTLNAGNEYHYSIGMRTLAIGVDAPTFRGVHVSRPLPSNGDIGEIRLKVAESHFRVPLGAKSTDRITSVEYSVSNVSSPTDEGHWLPIMPIGLSFIEGERFFLDAVGKGFFRFPASLDNSIALYRNGLRVQLDSEQSFMYSTTGQAVVGIKFPLGSYSPTDMFTVDYTPAADYSTINFAAQGFDLPPLVVAHGSTGAGERFTSTADRFTASLTHTPWVDYAQVATSTYDATFGLNPYQPITVQLETGVDAINLSNYTAALDNDTSSIVPTLPAADVGYYYYHSGSTLIFNQAITTAFRVFYQYLDNTVRVRTVLRVNSSDFVTPKVDYWHAKGKTRRPDLGNEV
jgi:hypothetical protein